MPERFKVVLDHARHYTSARLYLLPFICQSLLQSFTFCSYSVFH